MKVTIMRGIPGSGKSTLANKLRVESGKAGVEHGLVSADQFFIEQSTGNYIFDPTKLGEAHKECMRVFLWSINRKVPHIIVDNTNINLEDIAPYVAVAEAMDYEVEIVQVYCEPTIAAARNEHGVPLKSVLNMYDRLNRVKLPKRWKVSHSPEIEF